MSKPAATAAQRTSYALGLDFATTLKRLPVELDLAAFVEGLTDLIEGKPPKMAREEWEELMTAMHDKVRRQSREEREGLASQNVAAGRAYREEHAAKQGVKVTASGLQYEMIEVGAGETPQATDTVTVHYTGRLIDGTEFDSSHRRGQPATFPLNRVIKGWTEGLQLMQAGATCRFVIPPDLAYGPNGSPPAIGPEATLVFDVELLAVN